MEPEGSLPHSQVPATCPYLEPDRSSPYPSSHFLEIHLNIILPSTLGSPKRSLQYLHTNSVYACLKCFKIYAKNMFLYEDPCIVSNVTYQKLRPICTLTAVRNSDLIHSAVYFKFNGIIN